MESLSNEESYKYLGLLQLNNILVQKMEKKNCICIWKKVNNDTENQSQFRMQI